MPIFTPPQISDRTNQLIDQAVEGFDPELKPFFEIIRSGQPFLAREVATEIGQAFEVVLSTMARAVQTFGGAIRSLEIEEEERKAILRWLSQPRIEVKLMSSQEVFARVSERLSEMDAA